MYHELLDSSTIFEGAICGQDRVAVFRTFHRKLVSRVGSLRAGYSVQQDRWRNHYQFATTPEYCRGARLINDSKCLHSREPMVGIKSSVVETHMSTHFEGPSPSSVVGCCCYCCSELRPMQEPAHARAFCTGALPSLPHFTPAERICQPEYLIRKNASLRLWTAHAGRVFSLMVVSSELFPRRLIQYLR